MPWGFAALAAGSIAGGAIAASGSESAAKTEANSANNASQVQMEMFNQTQVNEQPYVTAGANVLKQLQGLTTPGGTAQFQNSPGYQFQVQQGENAILNNRSALGGVNSGNTLKALNSYGQGVANQDYWNYYNALQTQAGNGQNAAANLGSLGTQVGSSIGNNIIGAGNASAAGTVGASNAVGNAVSGIGQNYLLYNALNGGGSNGLLTNFGTNSFVPGADPNIASFP